MEKGRIEISMEHKLNQGQNATPRLLLDTPEDEVAFGFSGYASTLVSAIVNTEPQFTIGIFGDWGCGKTTLLRKIDALLKDKFSDKVLTVFFDAWRYQQEQHMLLPLLDTLSENLKQEQEQPYWKILNDKIKRLVDCIARATTIKMPGVLETKVGEFIKLWQQDEELRSRYYGWLAELQQALNELRHDNHERRIVVLIDDLDRCLPSKVVEMLESIKTMLDVTGIVFVIALDPRIVENAVDDYYGKDYGIQGKEYLKKLVQVEFRLPPLRMEDITEYIDILQKKLGYIGKEYLQALIEVVPSVVGGNLREVKRFINRVLLTTAITQNAGVEVPLIHQVAFMAMDFQWPGVTRVLSKDQAIFDKIGTYIKTATEERDKLVLVQGMKDIKEIFDKNPDLKIFLEVHPGNMLFSLSMEQLDQLLFYSSITKETVDVDVIDDVLSTLTPREQRVLQLRFGLEDGIMRSLIEIGREFNVTGQRIGQIIGKALRKLRHPTRSRQLRRLLTSMDELDTPHQYLLISIFGSEWKEYASRE